MLDKYICILYIIIMLKIFGYYVFKIFLGFEYLIFFLLVFMKIDIVFENLFMFMYCIFNVIWFNIF